MQPSVEIMKYQLLLRTIACAFIASFMNPVEAVTFEKTFLQATAAELRAGIDFPMFNLDPNSEEFVSVRVYRWTQTESLHVKLEPAPEIKVFPEFLRLAPDSRRSVRFFSLNASLSPDKEIYYRIVLEQYPPKAGTKPEEEMGATVRTRPKVTIPITITTNEGATPDLVVNTVDRQSGRISVKNVGNGLAAIRGIGDGLITKNSMLVYVQPGSIQTIDIPKSIRGADQIEIAYQGFSSKGKNDDKLLIVKEQLEYR